jgi:hypothetical protein
MQREREAQEEAEHEQGQQQQGDGVVKRKAEEKTGATEMGSPVKKKARRSLASRSG